METLEWLIKSRCPFDITVSYNAASKGHIKILEWLKSRGYELETYTNYHAAANGQIATLKWLNDNGCHSSYHVCMGAATTGQLNTIIWAHQNISKSYYEVFWYEGVYNNAVINGHLDVMIWVGQMYPRCADYAYIEGTMNHLEVLLWLHSSGFDLYPKVYTCAAARNQLDIIIWARQNGYE